MAGQFVRSFTVVRRKSRAPSFQIFKGSILLAFVKEEEEKADTSLPDQERLINHS